MKKLLIYILFFAIFSTIAFAGITITYQSSFTATKGFSSTILVNITNNNSIPIYNVELTEPTYFDFPEKVNISQNSTFTIIGNITTSQSFVNQDFISTFSFNNLIIGEKEQKTSILSLNRSFISNNNLNVFKKDTVRFFNNGTSNLTVNRNDSSLLFKLEPFTSIDLNMTDIGTFSYFIQESGFIGNIFTADNIVEQYIHDPTFDQQLRFSVKSINPQASVSIQSLLNNFVMNYNATQDGVLLLEANDTVINAKLSASKWLEFSENNFDFVGKKLVNYKIKPNINRTEDTDIVHSINVVMDSDNSATVSTIVNAYINKQDFSAFDGGSNYTFIFADELAITAFCKTHPEKCINTNLLEIYCKINPEACPKQEVLKNRSLTDEGKLLESLDDKTDRTLNKVASIEETQIPSLETGLTSSNERINALEQRQINYEDSEKKKADETKRSKVVKWVLGIFSGLLVGGFITYKAVIYIKENRSLGY